MRLELAKPKGKSLEIWIEWLNRFQPNNLYLQPWYLDLTTRGNWEILFMIGFNNELKALMPITYRRWPLLKWVCPPPLTQQCGILASDGMEPEALHEAIRFLNKKLLPAQYAFSHSQLEVAREFQKLEYSDALIERPNYVLDLTKDYSFIYSNFSKSHQRNIKKAQSLSIIRDVPFSNLLKVAQRASFQLPHREAKILQKMLVVQVPNTSFEVWVAQDQQSQKQVAACFWAVYKKRAYYLFGAATDEGRSLGASHKLVDAFIQLMAGKLEELDFEGSSLSGVARFYADFGAENQPYPYFCGD